MRIRVSTTVFGLTAALALPAFAQSTGDSLRTRADSLRADSVRADSVRRAATQNPTNTLNTNATAGARSDRRIPVTKDRSTTTPASPVDTTTQTQTQTQPQVTTPTPVDTTTPAPAPMPTTPTTTDTTTTTTVQTDVTTGTAGGDVDLAEARGITVRPSGLYFQLGGGAAIPTGDFSQYYHNGWNGTAAIGWQKAESPIGLRVLVGYNRLNGKTFGTGNNRFELQDPDLWSASVNADWRVARWGMNPHNGFYLTGGAGGYHFRNFGQNALIGSGSGNELATDNDRTTKFGLNGGLGFSFGIGNAALFVESRYVSIFAKRNGSNTVGGTDAALTYPNFENSTYIPLTIGFKF